MERCTGRKKGPSKLKAQDIVIKVFLVLQ